jgi:hypothetical protein
MAVMTMRTTRRGFTLLVVLLGVVVLSVLGTTALKMGNDEMSASRATRVSTSALFLADAGVTATRVNWPTGASALGAGSKWGPDTTTLADGSRYIRTIARRDNGGSVEIYALTVESVTHGALGGEAAVQVWLTSLPPSRFRGAINARTGVVDLGSTASVDSYDSSLGSYNVNGNKSSNGDIYTNADLKISGQANVAGAASIGGNFIDSSTGSVTGGVAKSSSMITYIQENCPSGGWSGIPTGPQGAVKYIDKSGNMTVSDSLRINVSGTYYWHDLTLNGGGRLIVSEGVTAKVYIGGKVTSSGNGGVTNRTGYADDLSIVSCDPGYPNIEAWTVGGGPQGFFTVYAPNSKITLNGSSQMYGAVVCSDFTISDNSQLHFDKALLGGTSRPNLLGRSWFQVLR